MRILLGLVLGLMSVSAQAYIPDYHMILSRVAENNGRGSYEIEQEVVFPADPEPLRVKETWIIKGEDDMSVTFTGLGSLKGLIQGRVVYNRSEKFFIVDGQLRKASLGEDWWQPFFHFRYSRNIKPKIVALKMAPASSLEARKLIKTDDKTSYSEQNFMRLSRTGGVVNYAIGTPTPVSSPVATPGLWIEQDMFLVRKIRLPSQALITADDYSRYSRYQWLPKKTNVEWDQNQAQVFLTRVDALSSRDKRNQLLEPKSLTAKDHGAPAYKLPDHPVLREFYQRFR